MYGQLTLVFAKLKKIDIEKVIAKDTLRQSQTDVVQMQMDIQIEQDKYLDQEQHLRGNQNLI